MSHAGTGRTLSLPGSIIHHTKALGGSWRKAGCAHGSAFSFSSPTAAAHENKLKVQHMFSWCHRSRQARSHAEGNREGSPVPWGLEAGWYLGDGNAQGHSPAGLVEWPCELIPVQYSRGTPERF